VVALWACWLFKAHLRHARRRAAEVLAGCALLLAGLFAADAITAWSEDRFYVDRIVYKAQSDYQRVVITQGTAGTKLFLNGNLQFSQRDEYRYHEALVHPAMSAHGGPRRVLVLGGGDGLAVREILRYPSVESVTLVDLDPHITRLFKEEPPLRALNRDALRSPKVQVVNADAFGWLEQRDERYDVIVVDFPDPSNFAVGKLYTLSFDRLLAAHLSESGFAVVQTTSPLVARRSFWTVATTLEAAGLQVRPYHAHVPSFGEWGFILASHRPWPGPKQWPSGLRFLTPEALPALFQFPADMSRVPTEVNRLSNQVLVREFEEEWGRVAH
jgi:spermidine synthase